MNDAHEETPNENMNKVPNPRMVRAVFILLVIVVVLVVFVLLSSNDNPAATPETSGATDSTTQVEPIANVQAATPPTFYTPVVVTENAVEANLQDVAKNEVLALDGVDTVLSLDIDLPDDEAPLAYVEIVVSEGFNNTEMADGVRDKLKAELNTETFSDFVVIITDPTAVYEYIYDLVANTWKRNLLSQPTPVAP